MLVLNLKTYEQTDIAEVHKLIDPVDFFIGQNPSLKDKVLIAPPVWHLSYLAKTYVNVRFAAQHVDNKPVGQSTGWLPAESLINLGINYSLYNHSEHRVWGEGLVNNVKKIQQTGRRGWPTSPSGRDARRRRNDSSPTDSLNLIVCCQTVEEAKILKEAKPFAIAYEPPDLIGTGNSVSNRPEVVKEFIKTVGDASIPLIGAGVSTAEDVKASLELGAKGVLVASAFVKAEDPEEKFLELISSFLR